MIYFKRINQQGSLATTNLLSSGMSIAISRFLLSLRAADSHKGPEMSYSSFTRSRVQESSLRFAPAFVRDMGGLLSFGDTTEDEWDDREGERLDASENDSQEEASRPSITGFGIEEVARDSAGSDVA